MSKTFLFIQGIYDTIDLFIEAFSQSLVQTGCACHVADIRQPDAIGDIRRLAAQGGLDGVITFNNIGYNLALSDSEESNIWEEMQIPYFNILMDHPFHYDYPLAHAPSTSVVFCTDRNHVDYLRRFYPHLKQVDFMPHAGMEADLSEYAKAGTCRLSFKDRAFHPAMEERPLDALYAGGLSRYVAEGLVPDLGAIREFDAFQLSRAVLSELMRHPEKTTESAIEEYLLSIGKQYSDKELHRWITELRFLDAYAVSFYREQAVRLFVENGIKTTVFGGGWDQCEWTENENFVYGGKILAPQVLELMNHSKITLNTMTWYKNGIHDRVINGMLAKSVVVSDDSLYLNETFFTEGETLLSFRLPEIQSLPERAKELLENPAKMTEIAENGYRHAKARHTFRQRAEYLLEHFCRQA